MNEINNNLQRVRELSVQALNGTNSESDLTSIQEEITQRLAEIDRVSEQTQFNGVKVLSSEAKSMDIQVGANDGETISIGLKEVSSSTLDLTNFSVSGLNEIGSFVGVDGDGNKTISAPVEFTLTATDGVDFSDAKLYGYGTFDETDGSYTSYAISDKAGNLYKVDGTKITVDEATGAVAINLAAGEAATFKGNYDTDATAGLTATANPLAAIDNAIKTVDTLRGELGAVQTASSPPLQT